MKQLKDKKTVQNLLKAAISHLCRVSVGLEGNFAIDGIICIAHGDTDEQEVVVKIHEKVEDREIPIPTPGKDVNISNKKQSNDITPQGDEATAQNISYVDNVISTKNMNNFCKVMRDHDNDQANVARGKQLLEIEDDDVEFLGISEAKQLLGDIDNFSDIECTGYDLDDVSFSDVVIKPDPGNSGKSLMSYGTSNIDEESSDEELKIEQLKAGRVRKPHKGAYRDVHGAPVQLLSTEEFKRILKSEKLKRSRDKSPDFVSAPKLLKTGQETFSGVQIRQQIPQSHSVSVQSQVQIPKTVVGSLSYLTNAVKSSTFSQPMNNKTSIVKHSSSSQENLHYKEGTTIQRSPSYVTSMQKSDHTRPKMVKSFVNQQTSGKTQMTSSTTTNVSINARRINDSARNNINLNQSVSKALCGANSYSEFSNNDCYNLIPQTVLSQSESPLGINIQDKINAQQNVTKSEPGSSSSGSVICLDTCNEATKSDVHKCPVCSEVFESFRFLDLHMYRQHPGMFLCPLCGKSFKQRSTRNRHIVALHSSEKNFICSMCNVAFTRADTLKKHISMSHPGIDVPKTTFSYTKGMELSPAVQSVQQSIQDYSSEAPVNDNLYGEGVITPIQVTAAALENTTAPFTTSDPSSFIAVQPGNITNVTPIHPNMGTENLILTHNITPNLAPDMSKDSFLTIVENNVIGAQQNEPAARNVGNVVETLSSSVPVPKATEAVITAADINVSGVSNMSGIQNRPLVTFSGCDINNGGNDQSLVTISASEVGHNGNNAAMMTRISSENSNNATLISRSNSEISDNSRKPSCVSVNMSQRRHNPTIFSGSNSDLSNNSANPSLSIVSTSQSYHNQEPFPKGNSEISDNNIHNPSLVIVSTSESGHNAELFTRSRISSDISDNNIHNPSLVRMSTSESSSNPSLIKSSYNAAFLANSNTEICHNSSKPSLITGGASGLSCSSNNVSLATISTPEVTIDSNNPLLIAISSSKTNDSSNPALVGTSITGTQISQSCHSSEIGDNCNKEDIIKDNVRHTVQPLNVSDTNTNLKNVSSVVLSDGVCFSTSNVTQNKAVDVATNVNTVCNNPVNSSVSIASIKPITNYGNLNPHENQAFKIYTSTQSDSVHPDTNTVDESKNLNVGQEVVIAETSNVQVDKTGPQSGDHMYENIVTARTVTDMCNTIEISDEDTNDQLQQSTEQQ